MKTKWIPFDRKAAAAETPLNVRVAGGEPVSVVINGHGQILAAATRRLLEDFAPTEMEVPDTAKPEK